MNVVSAWPTMELLLILLLILQKNCTREMFLQQEMSPLGKALAILHLSLEPS